MLTTRDILERTSKELGLPYEVVESNYKAWAKGIQDQLANADVLRVTFGEKINLKFNDRVPLEFYGYAVIPKKLKERLKRHKKLLDEKVKKRRKDALENKYKRKYIVNEFTPSLLYYGFGQAKNLKELEEYQDKFFEKYNEHNYD